MNKLFLLAIVLSCFSCKKEYKEVFNEAKLTCDAEMPENKLSFLQDSIPDNIWNSGSTGQHWINMNFKEPKEIKEITFEVPIWPMCTMKYDILCKKEGQASYTNVESQRQYTYNLQKFSCKNILEDVTDIKIVMEEDSSYPGLRMVSVLGR